MVDVDYYLALNAVIYVALAAGALTWRRQGIPKPGTPEEAFDMLERGIRHAFPDTKDGFTWREEMTRVRTELNPRVKWDEIQKDLDRYETYKYGDGPSPGVPGVEFLKLVKFLQGVRHLP